jgi:hypothetical protein
MKLFSPFLLIVISLNCVYSQQSEVYIPVNFLEAYQNQTRNFDGTPGARYWQNKANYSLEVSIDTESHVLSGNGTITYSNQSNDTLGYIVIRLYQDLFKEGASRDWQVAPADLHGGTIISSLEIDGNDIIANNRMMSRGTNTIVTLPEFLLPGENITINISWKFPIPDERTIRYGKYDDGVYFIAYWYPEISVYDDIDGWDTFNFTGMQEFYHDFSDYHVTISMPGDYVVWATGDLKNPQAVLNEKYLERYQQAKQSAEIVQIIAPEDLEQYDITRKKGQNTWIFKATNVPDFAFATSNHYLWDAVTYTTNETNPRNVFISSAYDKGSEDFYDVAEISFASVKHFSEKIPAFPFPYPAITVFNGSGGMEFPMMVNDASVSSRASVVHLTSHEIVHTYFPFMTGTNERKYAWMDEGWAVMLPVELQKELAPGYRPMVRTVNSYEQYAGHDLEVPLMISSINLGGITYRQAYRHHAYYKSAVAYHLLKEFLGDELFLKGLQEFITRWESKHPMPYDFFFTFDDVVGEDLSWFWKPWFFEMGYPDLSLREVKVSGKSIEVHVEKVGNMPVPVQIAVVFEDETTITAYESSECWKNGASVKMLNIDNPEQKAVRTVVLGGDLIPDVDDSNNILDLN